MFKLENVCVHSIRLTREVLTKSLLDTLLILYLLIKPTFLLRPENPNLDKTS